jgi:outer membrane autotransporter protein
MKEAIGAARMKTVELPEFAARVQFGQSSAITAAFALPLAAAIAVLAGSPAGAACLQSGNTVTCSGASLVGFGTGAENNLALTVQSDGSITAAHPVNLGDGNAVTNNGAITVVGGGIGIQGLNSNVFTNAGTVTLGANSIGIYTTGDNNTLTNTGTISSTAPNIFGIWVNSGNGNTVTNSGNIILTGASSFGIADEGFGSTITNSGTIKVSTAAFGGDGVELGNNGKLTNTGTIMTASDIGSGVSMSGGSTVINSGLIGSSASDGTGVWINGGLFGGNSTIVNNGMIEGRAYSLRSTNSNGNSVTNNGTLDGQISILGTGNSLINAGLITITDPGIALAAGNFSIGGTFTQTAQGTLALRVDNTGLHDSLYTTGQLALNGTLRVALQSGLYASSTTYTNVLQSGASVTGQFASVTSPSVFLSAAASYHASSVDLTLTRYGFGNVSGETANQRSIGAALESGYSTALTGSAATFFTRLLQAGSLRVLDQLSGEGTSGTQNAAFTASALFGQTMDSQMAAWLAGNRSSSTDRAALGYAAEAPNGPASAFNAIKAPAMAQPQWNAWAAGFGAGQQLSGNASVGSASFSDRAAGGAMGVDHLLNPDLLLGIAAGGSSATFSVDDRATSGRLEGGHIGAYAMQRFGASYLSAQIAYSHFNNSTTRTISGVGPDETAKGAFTSDQFGGRLEIGRSFEFSHVSVTPFAALQAARLWQGGYTETSTAGVVPGVLGLNYAAHAASSVPVFLGVKFDSRADFGNGMIWTPFVHAAWVHEFEPSREITASLNSVSVPAFTIEGARAASDAARLDLGSRLALNRWWELSARITGEFSRQGQTYAGMGSLRANW